MINRIPKPFIYTLAIIAVLGIGIWIGRSGSNNSPITGRTQQVANIEGNTNGGTSNENEQVQPPDINSTRSVKVTRVVDGDTIEIEGGEKVRYIGIDTPETVDPRKPVQCFGVEASKKNKEMVEGKMVRLEKDITDRDKYNRLLRYVWLDDVFVNLELVKQGFAYSYSYPPDIKYQDQIVKAQQEARGERKGVRSLFFLFQSDIFVGMPRPPRTIEGNIVYHVLNRANARMQIFEKEKDYSAFEKVLVEAKEKYPMRILAYCLMPNHWHFVLHPKESKDLALFMRWLTLTHTQRWLVHRNMVGYGHLYQGRYKSFPVQEDGHFLQVCKYVESNALRAGLSDKAENWRWGSAWVRKYGNQDQKGFLSKWPVPMITDYASWLNQEDNCESEELKSLRSSVSRGKPFGSESWVGEIANRLGLESSLNLRGRPKKGA